MRVYQNIALKPLLRLADWQGWETSVGQAFDTIFYTANYFCGILGSGGQNFRVVSPYALAKSAGFTFCCDQVAHYVPASGTMVWVLLTNEGPVLLCLSTPDDLKASKGTAWTIYALSGPVYSKSDKAEFDYPQIAVGDEFPSTLHST